MGIFSFFKKKSNQDHQIYKNAVSKLDFDIAIMAHQNWKIRLDTYLAGASSEDLNPAIVCCDDKCDLGKWIYNEGDAALGDEILFQDLKSTHKMFHYTASNVISLHQSGKSEEAQKILDGDFTKLSNKVVQRLEDFKELKS